MPNGPWPETPAPCTYAVATPSGALPGPSFSSVTRTTCSGRCAVPTNKSVDSTPAIRICSSLHAPAGGSQLAEPAGEGPRRRGRIVRLGDGPDHDHAGGAGREHLAEPVQAD